MEISAQEDFLIVKRYSQGLSQGLYIRCRYYQGFVTTDKIHMGTKLFKLLVTFIAVVYITQYVSNNNSRSSISCWIYTGRVHERCRHLCIPALRGWRTRAWWSRCCVDVVCSTGASPTFGHRPSIFMRYVLSIENLCVDDQILCVLMANVFPALDFEDSPRGLACIQLYDIISCLWGVVTECLCQ